MTDPIHGDKPHAWMQAANCMGLDDDQFFPARGDDASPAKAVCRRCAVREACLTYAMTPPVEIHGVWGGLTPEERRRLRRGERVA